MSQELPQFQEKWNDWLLYFLVLLSAKTHRDCTAQPSAKDMWGYPSGDFWGLHLQSSLSLTFYTKNSSDLKTPKLSKLQVQIFQNKAKEFKYELKNRHKAQIGKKKKNIKKQKKSFPRHMIVKLLKANEKIKFKEARGRLVLPDIELQVAHFCLLTLYILHSTLLLA